MADNVSITQGTGTTIAADDVGGVLHQRVKISQGADGVATDVSASAPLQVTVANTGANATAMKVTDSAQTMPSATTMQNGATANGNGTSLNVQGFSTAVLSVTASVAMSGGTTINFEGSVDDTTWVSLLANLAGTNTIASTTTTTGDYLLDVSGYKSVRARISAYSAGTISVAGYSLPGPRSALSVNANLVSSSLSNLSTNIAQLGGTTIDTNSGTKSAGTQRVVIATDQPNLTTPMNVKPYVSATVLNGNKNVTTAGTRVALATTTACRQVIIRAKQTNTGLIYVGDSAVASTNGHILLPGESVGLEIADLASVYLDSSVNGEGVTFLGSV